MRTRFLIVCSVLMFVSAGALRAAWQPGLLGGTIPSTGTFNTTAFPAITNSYLGPHVTTIKVNPTSSTTEPWKTYQTWAYWGEIYLEAATTWFAENIDDHVYLRIWDGDTPTVVLNNTTWNGASAGSFTAPVAGWYRFDLRLWNGGGGAGPVEGSGWTLTKGFGYKIGGASSTDGADYEYPEDNGTMSLFRYDDGLGFDDVLEITGEPGEYGSPVPSYGLHAGYDVNDTVSCAVEGVWTNADATVATRCDGWRVLSQTNQLHDIWVETTNGTGNAFTYTHGATAGRVVWQFDAEYKVAFNSAVAACTVTASSGWHGHGTLVSATAGSAPGYAFVGWEGVGVPDELRQNPAIQFEITGPVAATATYQNVWYVKEGGDDTNDGRSWETPFATIQHAIDQATAQEYIHVGSGSYNSTGGTEVVRLDKPVRIIAVDGPDTTILDPFYGLTTHPSRRAVTVTPDGIGAFLAGFTLTNGNSGSTKHFARTLYSDGYFTASNCVFRKSYSAPWASAHVNITKGCHLYGCLFDGTGDIHSNSEGCGALSVTGTSTDRALVERCNFVNYNMTAPNFALIRLLGYSTLRNCLVAGNQTGGSLAGVAATPSGAINITGSPVEIDGCTIANNHTRSSCGGGGLVATVGATSYSIHNTVIWGNTSISGIRDDFHNTTGTYADHLNRFNNSCGTFLADGVNGNVATPPYFSDSAGGDYTLAPMSPCHNAGAVRDWHDGAVDIAGQPRVQGTGVDIGALEADPAPPAALAVAAVFTPSVLPLPAVAGEPVTFNAAASGPDLAGLALAWDFGHDGATGAGASVQHTFPAAGIYTIICTATTASGSASTSIPLAVAPVTAYVAPIGTDTYPYDTWEKATTDLHAAVATGAREILVADGDYQLPDVRSVILARRIRVRGVSSPANATLKAYTSGNARHFDLFHPDARLEGLRLINGRTGNYGFSASLEVSDGIVSNCVVEEVAVVSRTCFVVVGGTGRLVDSTIRGRAASFSNNDGNMAALHITGAGLVDRCIVSQFQGFSYTRAGVNHSHVHSAVWMDSATATLRNSLVLDCTNTYTMTAGVLTTNCFGAGLTIRDGTVENCTFARNIGAINGAAIAVRYPGTADRAKTLSGVKIRNCAFYDNLALNGGLNDIFEYHAAGEISTCCSPELENGLNGNIAAVPTFKRGTWIPANGSPLVGNAAALDWMTPGALDLAGNPRIFGSKPDIGAMERNIATSTYLLVH